MTGRRSTRTARARLRARLELAIERAIAALDQLDGDADLEPALGAPENPNRQQAWAAGGDVREREEVSEDEGGACEDEGAPDDREPDLSDWCNWQDEGDQTRLRALPVYSARPSTPPRLHQNVTGHIAVRALPGGALRFPMRLS